MGKGLHQTVESPDASGRSFAIVAARWNSVFTDRLVEGALEAFKLLGASASDVTVVRVPGSYEIPIVVQELATTERSDGTRHYDGIVALGVLIRGDTVHYDLIAREVSSGLTKVMLETRVPVAHGVLAVENLAQAEARSGSVAEASRDKNASSIEALSIVNRGFEVAVAVVETAQILSDLRRVLPDPRQKN